MAAFFEEHLDAIITIVTTIIGFFITIVLTRHSFKEEVKKHKLETNLEVIKELPYEICKLIDSFINGTDDIKHYSDILIKILSYGSKEAVAIAIYMQQQAYRNETMKDEEMKWKMISAYALLITQLKYDITAEIIAPDSWFRLKIKDYLSKKELITMNINQIIKLLNLNKGFLLS